MKGKESALSRDRSLANINLLEKANASANGKHASSWHIRFFYTKFKSKLERTYLAKKKQKKTHFENLAIFAESVPLNYWVAVFKKESVNRELYREQSAVLSIKILNIYLYCQPKYGSVQR